MIYEVTEEPLRAEPLVELVSHPGAGGIVTFTGVVRDNNRGRTTTALQYEAYKEMAEQEMAKLAEEAKQRWPEVRLAMRHRVGMLKIGDPAVIVVASAPHRGEAFDACEWVIDTLKERVPIWKKEYGEGGAVWLD